MGDFDDITFADDNLSNVGDDELSSTDDESIEIDEDSHAVPERVVDPIEDQRVFLTKLILGGVEPSAVDELIRRNFSADTFDPKIKPKVNYILKRFRLHRTIPPVRALLKHFPTFVEDCLVPPHEQGAIIANPTPLHALYDEVFHSSLLVRMRAGVNHFSDAWRDSNMTVPKLWDLYTADYRELAMLQTLNTRQSKTLAEAVDDVRTDFYDARRGNSWGIPVPFPFLHEAMRGFQPGEITTVVGKPGVGKTWFALMCAVSAITGDPYFFTPASSVGVRLPANWSETALKNAKRVLLVSLEMPILQIARRLTALITKLPYPQIRAGKFTVDSYEAEFMRKLDMIQDSKYHVGSNCLITTASTVDQVASDADSFGADLVIIDGFYLMAGTGDKRWERVQGNTRDIRVHALVSLCHTVLISQLDAKEDRLAFSQSIEQDSSNVVVLHQTPVQRNKRTMDIESRKIRDGAVGDRYQFTWDIPQCRFSQLHQVEQTYSSDT